MLSIATISPDQGLAYYTKDNYYSEGIEDSEWWGDAASSFALEGSVNAQAFQYLLNGYSPDGSENISGNHFNKRLRTQGESAVLEKVEGNRAYFRRRDGFVDVLDVEKLHFFESQGRHDHGHQFNSLFEKSGRLDRWTDYKIGDVIIPNAGFKSLSLQKDAKYRVVAIDEADNALVLSSGKILLLSKIKNFKAYEVKKTIVPIGSTVNWTKTHGYQRRGGFDLTFSAPKSVSIASLIAGDKRLIKAHQYAVSKALEVAESRYSWTRIGRAKEIETTSNLIVARFNHDVSRENDPQLHTHCVVMNATKRGDGNWRTIHGDGFYRFSKLLGTVYQNELAHQAKQIGYEVEVKSNGTFELRGYTQEQLDVFSKRRHQVRLESAKIIYKRDIADDLRNNGVEVSFNSSNGDLWVEQSEIPLLAKGLKTKVTKEGLIKILGYQTGHEFSFSRRQSEYLDRVDQKSARHAVMNNRRGKKDLSRNEIEKNWQNEAFEAGIKHPVANHEVTVSQNKAVASALRDLSEQQCVFDREAIETRGFGRHLGELSFDQFSKRLDSSDDLVKVRKGKYTSRAILEKESHLLEMVTSGCRTVPIASGQVLGKFLESDFGFTKGQHDAFSMAATGCDQVMLWYGVAGSGKSYALKYFKTLAEQNGHLVLGFAPDSESVNVLQKATDIETETIASMLLKETPQSNKPQVWAIDEAGKIGLDDMVAIVEKANEVNARIIFAGDDAQNSPYAAGTPFRLLREKGATTAVLSEHRRQRGNEALQRSVSDFREGRALGALNRLGSDVKEIKTDTARYAQLIPDFMALPAKERAASAILVGTHKERHQVLKHLRSALKKEGTLGKSTDVLQLRSKDLSRESLDYAYNYKIGDRLIFHRDYQRAGIVKSEVYDVSDVDTRHNTVTITKNDIYKTISVDTLKDKSLYETSLIDVSVGERLRWTKPDRALKRRNGQEIVVQAIDGDQIVVKSGSGEAFSIDRKKPQHLDYGIVLTSFISQGNTFEQVFITDDGYVNKESIYTAASRASLKATIYTKDRDRLVEKASVSKVKENAMDHEVGF